MRLPRFWYRRLVKVKITCPHGTFIPGVYRPWLSPRTYACGRCGFTLKLSTIRGGVDW